jgi:hypothetical protein
MQQFLEQATRATGGIFQGVGSAAISSCKRLGARRGMRTTSVWTKATGKGDLAMKNGSRLRTHCKHTSAREGNEPIIYRLQATPRIPNASEIVLAHFEPQICSPTPATSIQALPSLSRPVPERRPRYGSSPAPAHSALTLSSPAT